MYPDVNIEFVHLVFCISQPVHISVMYTMPHDVELCLCEEVVVAHMVWMAMGADQMSHLNIKKVDKSSYSRSSFLETLKQPS